MVKVVSPRLHRSSTVSTNQSESTPMHPRLHSPNQRQWESRPSTSTSSGTSSKKVRNAVANSAHSVASFKLHDSRFPHSSCPKDGQDRVPPAPRNALHQVLIHFFQTRMLDFKVDEGVQAGLKRWLYR